VKEKQGSIGLVATIFVNARPSACLVSYSFRNLGQVGGWVENEGRIVVFLVNYSGSHHTVTAFHPSRLMFLLLSCIHEHSMADTKFFPNPDDYPPGYLAEYKGGQLIATSVIFIVLDIIFFGLRLYARKIKEAPADLDDWFLWPALIVNLAVCLEAICTNSPLAQSLRQQILEVFVNETAQSS
jgi:hypothetical protein